MTKPFRLIAPLLFVTGFLLAWYPTSGAADPGLVVTTTSDTVGLNGQTSLREALANAASLDGPQTITFSNTTENGAVNFHDDSPDTITIGGTHLFINTPVTISGPGADRLSISGNNQIRIFAIFANGEVAIRGLTLTEGRAMDDSYSRAGGAIYCGGDTTLTIEACHITDNTADWFGGGIYLSSSYSSHDYPEVSTVSVTIRDCTISNNTSNSPGTGGGGIMSSANLTILNSTLSGNTALNATAQNGGGGAVLNFGSLVMRNSTVTGNRASVAAGGGGIDCFSTPVTLFDTIVAGNFVGTESTPSDIQGQVETASRHNLIGDAGSAGGLGDDTNGNIVGVGGSGTVELSTVLDLILANHGGPTPTHRLVAGSPALDAGDPAFDGSAFTPPLTNDQRGVGFARISTGLETSAAATLDIGAYEFFGFSEVTEVTEARLQIKWPKPFGRTAVGSTSRVQLIDIANIGDLATDGLRLVAKGSGRRDFQLVQPTGGVLNPGATTFFTATFKPRSLGNRKLRIQVLSSAAPVWVTLRGRGVKAQEGPRWSTGQLGPRRLRGLSGRGR